MCWTRKRPSAWLHFLANVDTRAVTQDPARSTRCWSNSWLRDERDVSYLTGESSNNVAQRMCRLRLRTLPRGIYPTTEVVTVRQGPSNRSASFSWRAVTEGILLLLAFSLGQQLPACQPSCFGAWARVSCCLHRLEKEPWQHWSALHHRMPRLPRLIRGFNLAWFACSCVRGTSGLQPGSQQTRGAQLAINSWVLANFSLSQESIKRGLAVFLPIPLSH